ncbi:response regulator [Alcanivorax sp. JB21]|uniref:response regulator transcription factor n=1 Tax=Alcanivorax limicola TaxID=2874102 RepID=UPI001CBD683F|nr:response regulator [Alcanivorax limicola]MBZ2189877.1 response regulator [Alcanivorax limicola]
MTQQILVVEDDDALRTQLQRVLTRRDHDVVIASCAEECRAVLATRSAPLDAAILDLNLGDDNGLDLIEPVLAHSPKCRILMLTGYGSIPTAVAATRRGAHNYLTKPASLDEILGALSANPDTETPSLPSAPPSLERLEWEHIQRVLEEHEGNISAAARTLGIHRRTLQRRLKKRPSADDYSRDY